MLPVRIGLISQSTLVDFPALVKVASAINIQLARDVAPIWGVTGTVTAIGSDADLLPGIWPVYIVDDIGGDEAGFHLTDHGQPFARVSSGGTWSLAASHEVIEMAIDPSGSRLMASTAVEIVGGEIQDAQGKFEYLVEVCDPSEDPSCAYVIDGILVSDFYTPSFFDPSGTQGARYSFSGRLTRPRQVLPNGYLSWYNAATNTLQQLRHFGAPEIVDLMTGRPGATSLMAAKCLRSYVDRVTPPPMRLSGLPTSVAKTQQLLSRRAQLAAAGTSRARLFAQAAVSAGKATSALALQAAAPVPADAETAVRTHAGAFAQPGVLSVRPGIRISASGDHDQHVIVATASADRINALKAALPAQMEGVPVDWRAANSMQLLQAKQPDQYLAMSGARHELRQPDFAGQVFYDDQGAPKGNPAPLAAIAAARPRKPQVDYTPPADATLDAVTGPVTLVLHASPDAAWAELSNFLSGIQRELVVGMYDFTSSHILQALEEALVNGTRLTLTLDHPAKNPTADQSDEDTVSDLVGLHGPVINQAWALTNTDPKAPVWIYPNAYHIKVAVREDNTFWLSSGNWNNSNQPEIDLSDLAAAKAIAASHDRDWHVIVTNDELADTFRKFLQNDYDVARNAEAQALATGMALPRVSDVPDVPLAVVAAGRAPRQFFTAKKFQLNTTIQPLLTPDNYVAHVRPLIRSAKEKFYMQTQYIHPSGRAGDEDHDALIAAVKDLVDANVDVRLITSQWQTDDWVEKLVAAGIPARVLRRQPNVHNKGILVDGKLAMVSSQNWSSDGTLRNRDAGLIIQSTEAAQYFEEIFLHDWDHLASPVATQ